MLSSVLFWTVVVLALAILWIQQKTSRERFAGGAPLGTATLPVDRVAAVTPSVPTWPSINCGSIPTNMHHFWPNANDSATMFTNPLEQAPPVAPHQLVLPAIQQQAGFMPQQQNMVQQAQQAAQMTMPQYAAPPGNVTMT
jgi:hypothetical protein